MKQFKSLVFSLLLTFSILPLSSKAAVGVPLASPLIVGAGVVVILGGGAATGLGISQIKHQNPIGGSLITLGGIAMAAFGLFILEGEQRMVYSELDATQGKTLGLTASEVEIYNSELDQVNAINGEVAEELGALKHPTQADSVLAWMEVKDAVSPQTFKSMGAILMFANR
jgi:hypothetical protein